MTALKPPEASKSAVGRLYSRLSNIPMWALWSMVVLWTIPTLSLFSNSFRDRTAQTTSGFWNILGGDAGFTLDNYDQVLTTGSGAANLFDSLVSSFAIAIPATIIPIAFAAFAAYAFAWIDFKGREFLFIATVSLLAIPLQVALIPLLQTYVGGAHLTIPFTERTLTSVSYTHLTLPTICSV